ncbi:MAG: Lon protease family protein [Dehalococcoidia bacterium]
MALNAVGGLVEDLAEHYTDQPDVSAFLADVREGILADVALFRSHPLGNDATMPEPPASDGPEHAIHERGFRKYEINVVVDNGGATGAPVVMEINPLYPNLIGRIEREALMGALVTDFTLIAPGALHRANGGYLIIRADALLRAPMSWDALKRALHQREIVIEDVTEALGITSTRGLRPDPIPLDVKVVLLGDPMLYHLLYAADPEFRDLFKVRADFSTDLDRTPENETAYAAFIAAVTAGGALPMDRGAVARLIEESSRLVEDQRKLSARLAEIADLAWEAEHWAGVDRATVVGAEHVRRAVEHRRYRSSLIPERIQEMISRGVLLVRPEGEAVGRIHGLAVVGLGDTVFGRASRITATVGAGRDGVVDIERQVELGGRIHSKGVLILGGYLMDTYAQDKPLALSARLVFEQSYDEVEGDSASMAELLALISRLADAPLRQGFAVTGSVNQHGEAQAVGGVNQKIEGFFDTCVAFGLTGDQGVILPAANIENLMLRDDVVEAVATGRFQIHGVRTVAQALTLLTGRTAGVRAADGSWTADSVHAHADARLRSLAEALRDFATAPAVVRVDGAAPAVS